jgi:hypothetical protein
VKVKELSDSCVLISDGGELVDDTIDKRMQFHFEAMLDINKQLRKEQQKDISLEGKPFCSFPQFLALFPYFMFFFTVSSFFHHFVFFSAISYSIPPFHVLFPFFMFFSSISSFFPLFLCLFPSFHFFLHFLFCSS